jgi:hypothetical protein
MAEITGHLAFYPDKVKIEECAEVGPKSAQRSSFGHGRLVPAIQPSYAWSQGVDAGGQARA